MKTVFKHTLMLAATLALGQAMTSCSSNDDDTYDGTDANKTKTIQTYVDNVVVSTYKSLADEAIALSEACAALEESPTQANVQTACNRWIAARKYWELSEAFLYGAAADYNIDPSIDSWPLDQTQLNIVLANMANPSYVLDVDNLGYGLKGFHAVEYVIFRAGNARTVGEISANELTYATAVAENMRNHCIRLEASWAGIGNVSSAKQTILEEAEMEPTLDYGELMESAGETGNTKYKTQIAAYAEILQGASDIADEVGNTKITDPCSSGNVLDVESWYSWNSIADFADNIRSVRNAYYGSLDGNVSANSVSAYIKSLDSSLDTELKAAIATAISQIEAMPAPFRNHLTFAENQEAIDACNALKDALDKAIEKIQE